MLKNKITMLMNALGVSNDTLAQYAGFDPTNISRLKNGTRTPSADSATIHRLCDAIEKYAADQDCQNILHSVTQEQPLSVWLFGEDTETTGETFSSSQEYSQTSFHSKLDLVMRLADISNADLGRAANIDPSSISRFRTGHRIPKFNNQIVHTICHILIDRILEKERGNELASLISFPGDPFDSDALYVSFLNWLCELPHDNTQLINELITNLKTFSPMTLPKLPALSDVVSEDILSETVPYYTGRSGLWHAVMRFLGNALISGTDRLFLYSDEPMSWLTEDPDFHSKWLVLMALCIQKGIHIHIIHNIDRNIPEMVQAIQSWMPLYLSGMVTSYCNIKTLGNRFCHTVFLCPSKFCIGTFSAAEDGEDYRIWDFYTDDAHVGYYDHIFQTLLRSSSPLVTISQMPQHATSQNIMFPSPKIPPERPDDDEQGIIYQDVSIRIDHVSVTVTQLASSHISFTFSHPFMVNAFQEFVYDINHRDG